MSILDMIRGQGGRACDGTFTTSQHALDMMPVKTTQFCAKWSSVDACDRCMVEYREGLVMYQRALEMSRTVRLSPYHHMKLATYNW
jgi:hypothetical protein